MLDLNNCQICFEEYNSNDKCELRCGHCYHSQCISRWVNSHHTCPTCRCSVNRDDFSHLFTEQPINIRNNPSRMRIDDLGETVRDIVTEERLIPYPWESRWDNRIPGEMERDTY